MDDDYELMPQRDIEELKRELHEIKQGKLAADSIELKSLVGTLSNRLTEMNDLLRSAYESMKSDEEHIKNIGSLSSKLDLIIDQNSKIAAGILSVADSLKKKSPEGTKKEEIRMAPQPRQMPQFPPTQPMPTDFESSFEGSDFGFPPLEAPIRQQNTQQRPQQAFPPLGMPPPPPPIAKKGLFSKFKR